MRDNPKSGESALEQRVRTVQCRVNRLLCGIRERVVREMAEKTAAAILLGKPLDELYFEELESIDGVEDAILHIISFGELCHGNENAAMAAREAVENLSIELEDNVKRAAASVKAQEGAGLWVRTRDGIADLICGAVLACQRAAEGQEEGVTKSGHAEPDNVRQQRWPGATATRAVSVRIAAAQSWRARRAEDEAIFGNAIDPEWSMNDYQREISIHPGNAGAHFLLAQAFQEAGNLEGALAEYAQATRLAPNDPEGHRCLGEALHAAGEFEAAESELACALRISQNDDPTSEVYSLPNPWTKDVVCQKTAGMGQKVRARSGQDPGPPKERVQVRVCPNCEARIGTASVLDGPEDRPMGGHYEIVVTDDSCEQCRGLEGIRILRHELPQIVPPADRNLDIKCWCALVYEHPSSSRRVVGPKKRVRLADLKKTTDGKFDLSGLTKNEIADILWEETEEGKGQ